jgi:aminoglycoside/choline kinase family phosphotransferase
MTDQPIPAIADLSAEWFTDLLRRTGDLDGDTAVVGVHMETIGEGASMMSALARARLTFDAVTGAPGSLIVKVPTTDEHRLFIAVNTKFYEREVRFYGELAGDLPVAVPRCLFAEIDPATSRFLLILEDVGHLRQVDQVEGCGWDDAVTAVQALADFHAPNWGKDLSHLEDTFLPMNGDLNQFVIPMLFGDSWPKMRDKFADEMTPAVLELGDHYLETIPAMLDLMQGPNTLAHLDFRIDNILFGDPGVTLLDFQLCAVSNGVVDVAFFVSQSLRSDLAGERGLDLLGVYLDRLETKGVHFDRAEAHRKYQNGLVFSFVFPVNLLAGDDTLPERGKALALTMLQRSVAAIEHARAYDLFT